MRTLVSLGATQSYIDPVRFITNASSGKMGMAFVEEVVKSSEEVYVVIGKSAWKSFKSHSVFKKDNVFVKVAVTVTDFIWSIFYFLEQSDILIMVAAIGDYWIKNSYKEKIKKDKSESLVLNLEKTPDIISIVRTVFPEVFILGFCAETESIIDYAKEKRRNKGLEMLFVNDVSGRKKGGFELDGNQGYLLTDEGSDFIPYQSKGQVAQYIWSKLIPIYYQKKGIES